MERQAHEQSGELEAKPALPRLPLLLLYGGMLLVAVVLFVLIESYGKTLSAPPPANAAHAPGSGESKPDALVHVFIALTAILIAGGVLGRLFRYLGQPPVMGEVVAGILLGPSFLGALSPAAAEFILPASITPYLAVLAQLGVVLYMFLVGLELNHSVLRDRAHATLAICHASTVVPFIMGMALALALYPRLSSSDVVFTSFALFIGVALSITAFPVLARILTDLRMQRTPLGIVALGSAAAGDVIAWCLLAFVVGVAQAQFGDALVTLGLTAAYLAFMFLAVRPIILVLLARWENESWNRGIAAVIFAALLLSALTTQAIGIHALFGAFLLGAMIPHDSGLVQTLTSKLEDIVTVLLLPAFFALTGMRTRIGLVSGWEQWLLCALIIAVATVGKIGSTLFSARLTGFSWRDAAVLGLLMNTRGLVELIALNIGLELRVISPTLFAMMVLMAVATTMTAAPLLHLLLPRQEATLSGKRTDTPANRVAPDRSGDPANHPA